MIYIEKLTVKLPKVEALKNINLEVKAGQRVGLVGESGSGKTMLGLSLLGITPDPAINLLSSIIPVPLLYLHHHL